MEQQQEKNIVKTSGRRQSSRPQVSNFISSLPDDLTSDILLNLNAKSIAMSSCVSNLWSSITKDPYFIKSFETRSLLLLNPSILLFFKKADKLFVFTFPQHNDHHDSSYHFEPLDSYHIEYPKSFSLPCTESVNGLLCFSKSSIPTVWSPTMKQFLPLPKPEKSWGAITVFLGYDPIEGKYKVVCMPFEKFCLECRVFTLGSAKKSWRRIITNHNHLAFVGNDGRCINGVVYYRAYLDHMSQLVIMSFDVRSEKFKPITLPLNTRSEVLIAFEGRLSFVQETKEENGDGIKLWVLEDVKQQKWSDKSFRVPFKHIDKNLKTSFKLSGVTRAGEFIYLPSTIPKLYHIFYFHPERNSFRKVAFKGIPDDSNGLGDRRFHALQAFPNHIETLSSL